MTVIDSYFNWLCDSVYDSSYTRGLSYHSLFMHLFMTDFFWLIDRDENRAADGLDLRYAFADECGYSRSEIDSELGDKPCSVLEMMIGLAKRCEDSIAYDDEYGDRSGQWFWIMLVNLGLGNFSDDRYISERVSYILDVFLNRKYEDNQIGCPFFVKHPKAPLHQTELWMQLNWYLAELL